MHAYKFFTLLAALYISGNSASAVPPARQGLNTSAIQPAHQDSAVLPAHQDLDKQPEPKCGQKYDGCSTTPSGNLPSNCCPGLTCVGSKDDPNIGEMDLGLDVIKYNLITLKLVGPHMFVICAFSSVECSGGLCIVEVWVVGYDSIISSIITQCASIRRMRVSNILLLCSVEFRGLVSTW